MEKAQPRNDLRKRLRPVIRDGQPAFETFERERSKPVRSSLNTSPGLAADVEPHRTVDRASELDLQRRARGDTPRASLASSPDNKVTNDKGPAQDEVRTFEPGIASAELEALSQAFPPSHFAQLLTEGFRFYHTTFWYPLDREPQNIFETVVCSLKAQATPSPKVTGVEWWFSVLPTNGTPHWLLPCHFDRDNLAEKDVTKVRHPEYASVLFLNAVPYGELVVTDQVLTQHGIMPRQPRTMCFIPPSRNLYAVFPGHLYHGVIGRMWRPLTHPMLRVSMAVNYWDRRPSAAYLHDSQDCMREFRLDA